MSVGNRLVATILTSPLRRALSGSTVLIRYVGRRSGTTFTTPTQFARYGSAIVIAVAHPEQKTWWRNFREDHPLDVLIEGTWIPMAGRTIEVDEHPQEAAPLLHAYLARFPRAAKHLGGPEGRGARLVWCRPR